MSTENNKNDEIITVSLKNSYYISDRLMNLALDNLLKNHKYESLVSYSSIIDDSFVYQLKRGDKRITITRYGENEIETKIKGDRESVKKFILDLIAEITTILTVTGLEALHPDKELSEEFVEHIRKRLVEVLHETVDELETFEKKNNQ